VKAYKAGILFLLLIWTSASHAEYRVFLLKIAKPSQEPGEPEDVRFVESTLDPEQYRLYYTVYPNEKLSYVETWKCYGRTDHFTPLCPNPRAKSADETRNPASDPDQDQNSPPVKSKK
jgi:hypothetical protein